MVADDVSLATLNDAASEADLTPLPEMRRKKIGLLFVHGIGEQKRFDFLKQTVHEFAELLRMEAQTNDPDKPGKATASVTLTDRTADWKVPPGSSTPGSREAPVTLCYRSSTVNVQFECAEAWWADLGQKDGIAARFRFWLWGLGAWSAMIYNQNDASHVQHGAAPNQASRNGIAIAPKSVAGTFFGECYVRAQLLFVGVGALCIMASWSILKALYGRLFNTAPDPSLIVQYLGDVHTYEKRAAPGETSPSDPGFPHRVGIRRRMITEMVAMAAREDLDSWFVVAHSLGSVVAYNGLTEIGHTLPNYLSKAQWRVLAKARQDFLDPGNSLLRDDVADMMPARPNWLGHSAIINRVALFEKFGGFLSFGSPLGKFAGLWPLIVASAHDQADGSNVFPEKSRWVNLYCNPDIVSGKLEAFKRFEPSNQPGVVPKIKRIYSPADGFLLLAHLGYFKNAERFLLGNRRSRRSAAIRQRLAVMRWLLDDAGADQIESLSPSVFNASWTRVKYYASLALLLILGAAVFAVLARLAHSLADSIFQRLTCSDLSNFAQAYCRTALGIFPATGPSDAVFAVLNEPNVVGAKGGALLSIIVLCGLWRWIAEAKLNSRLAQFDGKTQAALRLLRAQRVAAWIITLAGAPIALCAIALDLGVNGRVLRPFCPDWANFVSRVPAAWLQAVISPVNGWIDAFHAWTAARAIACPAPRLDITYAADLISALIVNPSLRLLAWAFDVIGHIVFSNSFLTCLAWASIAIATQSAVNKALTDE